jgi:pimeloyl-ACP methyl ester carboxylesterase
VLLLHGFPELGISWTTASATCGRSPTPSAGTGSTWWDTTGEPPSHGSPGAVRPSQPGALTAALNWYRANDFEGYEQPVAVPTLFIASTRDPAVAPSGVRATEDWVTGSYRLESLDGVGHFIPEEAADTTSRLLLDHLSRRT